MTDREKLIAMMVEAESLCAAIDCYDGAVCEYAGEINGCAAFRADYLLANGVVVREKGEWTLGHVEPGYCSPGGNRPWVCPRCGWVMSWRLDKPKENFCPNCGADMRKGEDG